MMSQVYRCDRCKAIGEIEAQGNLRFTSLQYGFIGGVYGRANHLCPHCAKKLKEFLSDPNCMETVDEEEDMGEVSDGYHTFNQLYHHRAVLFAALVKLNKGRAWKSFKHSDGKFCFDKDGEWFIVGIDTPEGSYTYHYHKKYWDMFDCQELEVGKEWDGYC